jgi:hypothetical protein
MKKKIKTCIKTAKLNRRIKTRKFNFSEGSEVEKENDLSCLMSSIPLHPLPFVSMNIFILLW